MPKYDIAEPEEYAATDFEPRIVGFVCNWSAYSAVEMAGVDKRQYPAGINLVRLTCLGRLHLGLILKAFELGADGVMLLGCPPDDCHYESGMAKAKELFHQAKRMLHLLGIDQRRLALAEMPLGRGDLLAKRAASFVRQIRSVGASPLASKNTPPRALEEEKVICQQ